MAFFEAVLLVAGLFAPLRPTVLVPGHPFSVAVIDATGSRLQADDARARSRVPTSKGIWPGSGRRAVPSAPAPANASDAAVLLGEMGALPTNASNASSAEVAAAAAAVAALAAVGFDAWALNGELGLVGMAVVAAAVAGSADDATPWGSAVRAVGGAANTLLHAGLSAGGTKNISNLQPSRSNPDAKLEPSRLFTAEASSGSLRADPPVSAGALAALAGALDASQWMLQNRQQTETVQRGLTPSEFTQLGVTQTGFTQPGLTQSGAMQSKLTQIGPMQPGLGQPGLGQPGLEPPPPEEELQPALRRIEACCYAAVGARSRRAKAAAASAAAAARATSTAALAADAMIALERALAQDAVADAGLARAKEEFAAVIREEEEARRAEAAAVGEMQQAQARLSEQLARAPEAAQGGSASTEWGLLDPDRAPVAGTNTQPASRDDRVTTPSSVAPIPELVAPIPDSVAPIPELVAPDPDLAAPAPESFPPAPASRGAAARSVAEATVDGLGPVRAALGAVEARAARAIASRAQLAQVREQAGRAAVAVAEATSAAEGAMRRLEGALSSERVAQQGAVAAEGAWVAAAERVEEAAREEGDALAAVEVAQDVLSAILRPESSVSLLYAAPGAVGASGRQSMDVPLEVTGGASADTSLNASPDASMDASLDASMDLSRDVSLGLSLDASPDASMDAFMDASPDASMDASQDDPSVDASPVLPTADSARQLDAARVPSGVELPAGAQRQTVAPLGVKALAVQADAPPVAKAPGVNASGVNASGVNGAGVKAAGGEALRGPNAAASTTSRPSSAPVKQPSSVALNQKKPPPGILSQKKPPPAGLKIGLTDLDPGFSPHRLLNLFPEIDAVEERFVSFAAEPAPSPRSRDVPTSAGRAGVTLVFRPGVALSSRAVARRVLEASGDMVRASVVLQPVLSPAGSTVRYAVYTRARSSPVGVARR